ncbi:hepcidin-1 [Engraulis encrasicolus]|uniref:hepcidin-1 n=1 Tax=Engraulis encrasicolus TaxID=184585 RepID=UPI002FD3C41F
MKCLTTIAAVTVLLSCICILNSAAVPFSEVQPRNMEAPETEMQDLPMASAADITSDTTHPLAELIRTRRHLASHLSMCRYCCNCCHNKGCGYCCRF